MISAAPAAAVEQQKEAFTGGAFDFRKPGLATSRPVPPSEVDPMPLLGDLKWDRRSLTNQLVVQLDARSAALNEALLRTTDARVLGATPLRDDHTIFPEPLLTAYTNQGYTLNSGSDWLGYVYQNTNGNVPTIQ